MGIEEYLLDKARTEGMERGIERGMEKGLRQGKEQFVRYLIAQLGFDDEQAASAARVSAGFAERVRQAMVAGPGGGNSGS